MARPRALARLGINHRASEPNAFGVKKTFFFAPLPVQKGTDKQTRKKKTTERSG
jgi:hypothetical protein